MALPEPHVPEIAQVIQLSLAPVFMLAGLGAIINALATRTARIVDRARELETAYPETDVPKRVADELRTLSRRARLVGVAMALSVLCALMISLVIALAFVQAFIRADLSYVIAGFFVTALFAVSGALIAFLREIALATANLRIGHPRR